MRPGGWRAARWWLEVRRPQDWGRKPRLEDVPVDLRWEAERIAAAAGVDPDELLARAERLLKESESSSTPSSKGETQ
jgi:hypothetical protein